MKKLFSIAMLVMAIIVVCGSVNFVLAQVSAPTAVAPPAPSKIDEIFGYIVKLLPVLLGVYGSQLTSLTQKVVGAVPKSVAPFVSVFFGAILSGISALATGAPVVDTAVFGGLLGGAGHPLKQSDPIPPAKAA